MEILKNLGLKWKAASTTKKISTIFDVITMIGGGLIGTVSGKKLSEGQNILGAICIRVTTAGVGIAAGELASQKLTEAYAEPLGKLIDRARNIKEEDEEHEYTRY